jgi:hypothetical protein
MTDKSFRLGKVAIDLNVGISTLVAFLKSKGITVEENPNTKLNSEEFNMLSIEFSGHNLYTIKSISEEIGISASEIIVYLRKQGKKIYQPTDRLSESEYLDLKLAFKTVSKYSDQVLSKYFDLSAHNSELNSAGEVEIGKHGIEKIGHQFFASLYHIQQRISKGDLREFLNQYVGTKMLYELGSKISTEYAFKAVKVKYKSQSFEIKKFPFDIILDFFLNNTANHSEILSEAKENSQSIGLKHIAVSNFKRFNKETSIDLSKINFLVGPNNAGKSTIVESIRLVLSYLKQKDHSIIHLNENGNSGLSNYGRIRNMGSSAQEIRHS